MIPVLLCVAAVGEEEVFCDLWCWYHPLITKHVKYVIFTS